MKTKSLAAQNRYLTQATRSTMVARNLASSTSVETGKNSTIYVARYNATRSPKNSAIQAL